MPKTYTNPIYPFQRSTDQDAATPVHHPVIIVGGGQTGLYCALDLAKQGIASVVLDDDNSVSFGSRALCYSKRALEVLDRVGCGQPVVDKGVTWQRGKVFFHEQQVFQFDLLPESGHQRPAFVNIQQYFPEEYLVTAIANQPKVDLRWLSKVSQVRTLDDGVEVDVQTPEGEYSLRCDYLLVADGANSSVRTGLGLESKGQEFDDTFLIADIIMKADFPTERWFWFDPPFHPGQSVLLHKQPDGVWRIDFQLGPKADRDEWSKPEKVAPLIRAMLGDDVEFDFEWLSVYRFRCRRMDSFLHDDGRILFVGDSAHQVSPFGARGGNAGFQSAENIIWKLTRVMRGTAPRALLKTYDNERIHGAKENILHSTRATDFITPKNRVTRLFRDTVLDLARDYPFARTLINSGRLSVPCVYADSPLNTPDAEAFEGDMCPGTSCKDAPLLDASGGQASWLLDHVGDRFVLMVQVDKDLAANADFQTKLAELETTEDLDVLLIGDSVGIDHALQDAEGYLRARYDLRPGTAYLIRPDQHVSARWRDLDVQATLAAMNRALGAELENLA